MSKMTCRICGQVFDPANLHEVFFHEHRGMEDSVAEVIGITGRPKRKAGKTALR